MESPKVRMALNPLHSKAVSLYGAATQHRWGRPGRSSLAAHINAHNKTAPTHPDQPYSEFILSSQQPHQAVLEATPTVSLHDYIQSQVIEVDPNVIHFYRRLHSQGLPYTLRIVSVAYPQPLRVHPDAATCESLAKELSFQNPIGRPVMLVALGQVDCLFGFQSFSSIAGELLRVPEFMDAVGQTAAEQFVRRAKSSSVSQTHIVQLIMGLLQSENSASDCLSAAAARLRKMPKDTVTESDVCFMSLQQLYPDDPMCFAVYFLNRVKLKEGNAIFIHENEPYSILEGDFMEASTSSDAYVIGGLSNVTKHPIIFARCLSYDDSPIEVRFRYILSFFSSTFGNAPLHYVYMKLKELILLLDVVFCSDIKWGKGERVRCILCSSSPGISASGLQTPWWCITADG